MNRVVLLAMTACAAMSAVSSAHAQNAATQAAAQTYSFNIPAGKLSKVLMAWAETAGYQYAWSDPSAQSLESPGVSGRMTAEAALKALTTGTGVMFTITGDRTVTIRKVATNGQRVLGPVRVEGSQQDAPVRIGEGIATLGGERGHQEEETRGYRPVVSSVGSGRPIPIEDNPRSISVLTHEQMEDQNVNDLGDALGRLPGVTIADGIYSRGQKIETVQIDGSSALDLASLIGRGGLQPGIASGPELGDRLNLAAYDRVELLRGGNSAFIGNGSLGGTLNLVRKRPGAVPAETLTVTAGSWDRLEGLYDVTLPNIGGSNIAFRGVTDVQTTQSFYDKFRRKNGLLYGIFDVPLSESSRAELGVRYSNSQTDSPYMPVLRYADGPLFESPRTTNFGPTWSFANEHETELFTRIKTDFSSDWNVSAGLSWLHAENNELYEGQPTNQTLLSNGQKTVFATTITGSDSNIADGDSRTLTGDVRVSGRFVTWGITHNFLAQAAYYDFHYSNDSMRWSKFSRSVQTINDFFLDDIAPDSYHNGDSAYSDRRVQGSIEDLVTWNDKVDLRLALARNESDRFQFTPAYIAERYFPDGSSFLYPTQTTNSRTKADWTPSYSVVFKPWRGFSIAPSYAEGTTSQSFNYGLGGEQLGPAVYKNQELMMRYATARWVASASYYDNDNTNVAESIPNLRTCGPTAKAQCYFESGQSVSSKGYDLELAGELFEQLAVTASYNYNDTRLLATMGVTQERPVNTQSPARTAKAFLTWKPPFLPKWNFSAGYTHRSDIYASGTLFVYDASGARLGSQKYNYLDKGYNLFDLGARYIVSPAFEVSLLAENLTDQTYLITTNQTNGYYGRPRNFSLNVKWTDPSMRWAGEASAQDHYPLGDPTGWYTALELGARSRSTVTAKSPKASSDGSPVEWDYKLGSNFLTFWRIGQRLTPDWRLEFEAGFRPTDIKTTLTAGPEPRGLCSVVTGAPAYPNCRAETGKFDTYSAMVNGIYAPWGEQRRVAPLVGLGLGLAVSQVEIGGRLTSRDIAGADITAGTDDLVFRPAAQLLAGLALKLTPRLSADLTYRYFHVPDVKWKVTSDYYNGTRTIPYGLDHFKGNLDDQSVSLAFRWTFDAGSH